MAFSGGGGLPVRFAVRVAARECFLVVTSVSGDRVARSTWRIATVRLIMVLPTSHRGSGSNLKSQAFGDVIL